MRVAGGVRGAAAGGLCLLQEVKRTEGSARGGRIVAFQTAIARYVSQAVEQASGRMRTGAYRGSRRRGHMAWAVIGLLGVITLSPIVASASPTLVFTLGGTAFRSWDPTAAPLGNFVVAMDTSAPGSFGFATRTLAVPIGTLTGFLSVDYYLVGRGCGGGSSRSALSP